MGIMFRLARLIAVCVALCCGQAQAADRHPAGFAGFTHSSWTSKDGVPGSIQALAQTPDGFLWLGGYEGLFRFDGVSFERVPPAAGHPPGAIPASAVTVTRAGELWVGYAGGGGVEVYRRGRLVRANMPDAPGEITELREDLDGAIWAVGGRARRALKRHVWGRWENIGEAWGVPDRDAVSSLFVARDGTLWIATSREVLILRRGARRFEAIGVRTQDGAGFAQDAQGNVWISDPRGTWMLPDFPRGARIAPNTTFYPAAAPVRRTALVFDRAGDLWGTTYTGGVFRIAAPGAAGSFADYRSADGLTSNQAMAVLEDREGSIWVATEAGLDQFRRANITPVPMPPKTSAFGYRMAADDIGDIYVLSGPVLYRSAGGADARPVLTGPDRPQALCRADRGVWLALPGRIMRVERGRVAETLDTPDRAPVHGCGQDATGNLWLARFDRGLLRRAGGRWQPMSLPESAGRPQDVIIDVAGRPVIVLDRRSIAVVDGTRATIWPGSRLGVSGITSLHGSPQGVLVAGGTGMARIGAGALQRLTIDRHPWLRGVRGLVETPSGETWMLTNRGIVRLATSDLDRAFADPEAPLRHELFDEQDGFTSRAQGADGVQTAMAADGRLWLLTRQGVVRVDPHHLSRNQAAPPVRIRALTANGRRYADPASAELPAGTGNLSIDYTALSLAVPSRVRFRYKLEGVDANWVDPGIRRQAFYTNLAPGTYRFRVIAANNDGIWNREGASLVFTVPRTFLQSPLFALLCAIAVAALLWLLYRLRMRALAHRMRTRMAERLAERERIARELHDTLLQGVQALALRVQLVADDISPDQPARRALEEALDRTDEVLAEGRDRVRDLRMTERGDDLQRMLLDIARRQAFPPATQVHVATDGQPRPLNPLVSDEVARIANEALFNIWRHAQASRVEIDIAFRAGGLAVRFRDDGLGMAPEILRAGTREGHFGLTGMRERARKLQAEFAICSTPGAGTEIGLIVPAALAYARRPRRALPRWVKTGGVYV